MSQSISAVEARQKLGEILNRVALRREEIIIERAGKKIARLSPIDNDVPRSSGKLDFRKAAGLGKASAAFVSIRESERAEGLALTLQRLYPSLNLYVRVRSLR